MGVRMLTLLGLAGGLTLVQLGRIFLRHRRPLLFYLGVTWVFFLAFVAGQLVSFRAGNWVVAILSFLALREYFSMVDVRLQDRLGILGAYASIPFMFHFVTIDWYGMFIVSIPVYSFLAIPLLISLGGKQTEGTIFSVGVIDFGLFLCVYCMGHVSYLMMYSVWMAVMLILNVAVCDLMHGLWFERMRPAWVRCVLGYLGPAPVTVLLTVLLCGWMEIPVGHGVILGTLIPLLVLMGRHTGSYIEADLGVREEDLYPGRGQILDSLKSLLFAAPVVFHYLRHFFR